MRSAPIVLPREKSAAEAEPNLLKSLARLAGKVWDIFSYLETPFSASVHRTCTGKFELRVKRGGRWRFIFIAPSAIPAMV